MSAKTLKSEVAAAAVATSGCGPEGVEVVEGAEGEQAAGEARLALMAAGTQRGLRVGPAQNAEQALARALEASPFDTVEEARAAMLPAESLAALAAEVEAYQAAYAAALAVCQQLEDCEEPEGLEQSTAS